MNERLFEWQAEITAKANQLTAELAEARTIIEPFEELYDDVSIGPCVVGKIRFSSPHFAAYRIGNESKEIYEQDKDKIFPATDWSEHSAEYFKALGRGDTDRVNELTMNSVRLYPVDVNRETLPKWVAGAKRMHAQMVAITGQRDEASYNAHAEAIRGEADRAAGRFSNSLLGGIVHQLSASDEDVPKLLSLNDELIVEALRKANKPLRQEELLIAAKLKPTGSNKQSLAQLVERNILVNNRKGYSLPEWKAK